MQTAKSTHTRPYVGPSQPTVQSLVLQTACELAGGEGKLAHHLGVSAMALSRWLHGVEKPPTKVFLDCVDIVLFHERHLASGAR